MHVLVPDRAERARLEPLPGGMQLAVFGDGEPPADTEWVVAADVVERLGERLAALPRLRVVQSESAGVDWLLPMVPAGVTVCDAAGVHDVPVAEWTVGAILAALKRFAECRDGQLDPAVPVPTGLLELCDRRVLILGHGSIGRAVADRLAPFGCSIRGVARHARPGVSALSDLPGLLGDAEILVILLPLTDETERIVDAPLLAALPDDALVVNAGRGRLVDQEALVAELQSGRLRAALDVTDPEPLPAGHPLRTAPNVLITPHIAGDSPRFLGRAYDLVRRQLEREAAGEELLNVVSDGY
jgi:phosphoglycerate dehydrogenase-like enzyme